MLSSYDSPSWLPASRQRASDFLAKSGSGKHHHDITEVRCYRMTKDEYPEAMPYTFFVTFPKSGHTFCYDIRTLLTSTDRNGTRLANVERAEIQLPIPLSNVEWATLMEDSHAEALKRSLLPSGELPYFLTKKEVLMVVTNIKSQPFIKTDGPNAERSDFLKIEPSRMRMSYDDPTGRDKDRFGFRLVPPVSKKEIQEGSSYADLILDPEVFSRVSKACDAARSTLSEMGYVDPRINGIAESKDSINFVITLLSANPSLEYVELSSFLCLRIVQSIYQHRTLLKK